MSIADLPSSNELEDNSLLVHHKGFLMAMHAYNAAKAKLTLEITELEAHFDYISTSSSAEQAVVDGCKTELGI